MNNFNGNILFFSNSKNGKSSTRQVKEGYRNFQDTLVKSRENSVVKEYNNVFRLHSEPSNRVSCEDRQVRLVEYDSRMRQEAEKYSRLMLELSGTYWFTRHVAEHGGFDWSKKTESDSNDNYFGNRIVDNNLSSDLEATRLTEDEILYGGDLTLDQVILKQKESSVSHI